MRALRQTFLVTPAMKVALDRSAVQQTTNYICAMKSTNVYVQNMLHNVINYHHVSIALAIITGVALQEYKEYNNLSHGISETTQSSINIDGAKTYDSQVIATTFNTYFATVAQNIHTANFNSIDVNDPLNYLYNAFNKQIPAINLKMVTSKEIENVVKSLKPKGSHGYDEIPTKILKLSGPYILSPLT